MELTNNIYIRKLNKHELGWRKGKQKKAGPFILISKKVKGFFPLLLKDRLNDIVSIYVISPESNIPVICHAIWHNSKHATRNPDENRDEVRLYINTGLDPNSDLFSPNDIVIWLKYKDTNEFGQEELYYRIFKFSKRENIYKKIDEFLDGKNHYGFIMKIDSLAELLEIDPHDLQMDSQSGKELLLPEDEYKRFEEGGEIHKKLSEYTDMEEKTRATRPNQKAMEQFVKQSFKYKCAITGQGLVWTDGGAKRTTLECAHIKPYAHCGPLLPQNLIPIRKDMHIAFDRGLFTINTDCKTIKVSDKCKDSPLLVDLVKLDGKELYCPDNYLLDPKFIEHHQKRVFENFVSGRQIKDEC